MDPRERTFLDCYEADADGVFRHAYFKTHDRELARDIAAEAFMRTWNALREGAQIDNLRAFVYRTAGNLVIDHYRKKKESSLDALQEVGFDPGFEDESIVRNAEAREAFAAAEQLEEPYREAIHLRYAVGLSIGEIAELVEESENVVSVRIHRGIKKLQELITHERPH